MVSKVVDTLIVFRILKILTTKWKSQKAYRLGIIDDNGKPLKKSADLESHQEKNAYTLLHRLVFNLKRIIEKVPFGKMKLASYIAALALIKEHVGSDEAMETVMERLDENFENLPEVPLKKQKHDIATKEGYLAAMEEALMAEVTSVAGAAAGGISGIGNSSVPDTIVVPKKRKKDSPFINFLKRN